MLVPFNIIRQRNSKAIHLTKINNRRHVAAAKETTQRKRTVETFLDVHKSWFAITAVRSMRKSNANNNRRGLCRFTAE